MHTFHKDIGLPKDMRLPVAGLPLTYSLHATTRAREKYIPLPVTLPMCEVVEVTYEAGNLTKWVVRVAKHVRGLDLVMVVQPDGFVRTVWTNAHFDTHTTLDKSKYERVR